jgi:hypothetical protein
VIRSALRYARKGLAVFPCGRMAKTPACPHGCHDATRDAGQIREWWRVEPNYNIGIATGRPSGIFVVDIDGPDAEITLRKLEQASGALPASVEAITGKGRHIYFKMPDADVRNSVGAIGPGLDIRGSGGFVIAPPSVHPSGRKYCWSVDSASAVVAAPDWLIERVSIPPNGNGRAPSTDWIALLANGVDEGQRDNSLAKIAGHLLRRYVNPYVTIELLLAWNAARCRPPLPDDDIIRVVNSICGKELRRRAPNGRR